MRSYTRQDTTAAGAAHKPRAGRPRSQWLRIDKGEIIPEYTGEIVVGKLRVIMAVADDSEGCHQMLYESKSAPLRSGAPNELSPKSTKSKLSMYRL